MTIRRLPKAYATLRTRRAVLRFYHGDALEVFDRLGPSRVDAIVTSPPYNLGVRYRTYNDSLPADSYQDWTDRWIRAAAAACIATAFVMRAGSVSASPNIRLRTSDRRV